MSANGPRSAVGKPVARYHDRFRAMAPDPRAEIPAGYVGEMDRTPIRVQIRQRLEKDAANLHE